MTNNMFESQQISPFQLYKPKSPNKFYKASQHCPLVVLVGKKMLHLARLKSASMGKSKAQKLFCALANDQY